MTDRDDLSRRPPADQGVSMSNIMQDLHTVGLNPFSVQLLAESLLKSPVALMSAKEPLKLFFPVQRGDPTEWPEDLRVQQWPGGAS